jgi:hypothetical protein
MIDVFPAPGAPVMMNLLIWCRSSVNCHRTSRLRELLCLESTQGDTVGRGKTTYRILDV